MVRAIVREFRPEDREAVRRICFETGMMGDSIDGQYRDLESFADMLTSYYTDAEPESALVAELDGKVVGYMLSCRDTKKAWKPGDIAIKHLLLRGTLFRRGTAAFYWRGFVDMVRDLFAPSRPRFDMEQYPSHTHNNLLPEGRGGGVGREFFYRVFDRLKLMGSRGLHGEVWARNENMVQFLEALGYKRMGEPYLSPGLRYPNGERVRMQLVVKDLSDWVPGSWKKSAHETAQSKSRDVERSGQQDLKAVLEKLRADTKSPAA